MVLEASGLSKSDWLPRGSARLPAETPGARRPLQQLLCGKAAAAGAPTTAGQSRQAPGTGTFLLRAPDTRQMLVTRETQPTP